MTYAMNKTNVYAEEDTMKMRVSSALEMSVFVVRISVGFETNI